MAVHCSQQALPMPAPALLGAAYDRAPTLPHATLHGPQPMGTPHAGSAVSSCRVLHREQARGCALPCIHVLQPAGAVCLQFSAPCGPRSTLWPCTTPPMPASCVTPYGPVPACHAFPRPQPVGAHHMGKPCRGMAYYCRKYGLQLWGRS